MVLACPIRWFFCVGICWALLWSLWSCVKQVDCKDSRIDYFVVGIYSPQEGGAPILRTHAFDRVEANPDRYPEPLYTAVDLLKDFRLPVHPDTTQMTYNFCKQETCQELTLFYEVSQGLLSADCGARYTFVLKEVVSHSFDSVRIRQAELLRHGKIHVQIFQ